MELLQYLERQQLAWQRCANDILDGKALAAANDCWLCAGRGRGRLSLVAMVHVDSECGEEFRWKKGFWSLAKVCWEGEV